MFMRISWGRVKDGMWDEYEKRYAEAVGASDGPKASSRWLARDMDDADAGYSISLWENEDDMRTYASDPAIREKVQETFGDLFTGEYETRHCRVEHTA